MRTWAAFVFAACFLSCARQTATPPADAGASSTPDASANLAALDGEALFQGFCAVCHGTDAKGYKADHAPSLVNPTFLESATDEFLRRSIVDGRPGTSMAPYGKERGGPLGPAEIARIIKWLRGHGPIAKTLPSRPNDAKAPDARRGAPIYAANCAKCHGGAHNRSDAVHLANTRFLEVASDSFLAWAIRNGRPGTPMEAWQTKLDDGQIEDVVAYVRSFEKPAAPETLPAPTGTEPIVINPKGGHPTFKPRSTPCPANTPCEPDNRFVSIDQVKQALEAKKRIVIIDARPTSDWMRVHIPGAVSIPYHDLKRLDEVPKDGTWVVAYCACPHHLSGDVVNALRKQGVSHAVILDEGILDWHRRGYPVVAAPGVEPPPPATPPPSVPPSGLSPH